MDWDFIFVEDGQGYRTPGGARPGEQAADYEERMDCPSGQRRQGAGYGSLTTEVELDDDDQVTAVRAGMSSKGDGFEAAVANWRATLQDKCDAPQTDDAYSFRWGTHDAVATLDPLDFGDGEWSIEVLFEWTGEVSHADAVDGSPSSLSALAIGWVTTDHPEDLDKLRDAAPSPVKLRSAHHGFEGRVSVGTRPRTEQSLEVRIELHDGEWQFHDAMLASVDAELAWNVYRDIEERLSETFGPPEAEEDAELTFVNANQKRRQVRHLDWAIDACRRVSLQLYTASYVESGDPDQARLILRTRRVGT